MAGRIRPVELSDVPAMLAIYGPVVLETTISWEYDVPSQSDFESRVKKVLSGGYPWIVMLDDAGELAGYAYAGDFRDRYGYRFCCESSIYLRSDSRGKGWGRALYSVLLEILTRQQFVAVIGGMSYPNPASEALHQALGFSKVGICEGIGYKFGEWLDVSFMQKELAQRLDSVGEAPLRFDDLLDDGRLTDLFTPLLQP